MEKYDIERNAIEANEWQVRFGYSPKPDCEKCQGTGQLYPREPDGRINYTQIVMCDAPRCLKDSFNRRSL